MQLYLFGQPSIRSAAMERSPHLPADAWQLLALLVTRRAAPLARDYVAYTLWPDLPESAALANLRRRLHVIRRECRLGDALVVEAASLGWDERAGVQADVVAFEHGLTGGNGLEGAVERYGGDLLETIESEWLGEPRAALRDRYVGALDALAERAQARRDWRACAAYARRILAADPWREDALRWLMVARYGCGDRAGALAELAAFSRRVRVELNIEPMAETLALGRLLSRRAPERTVEPAAFGSLGVYALAN